MQSCACVSGIPAMNVSPGHSMRSSPSSSEQHVHSSGHPLCMEWIHAEELPVALRTGLSLGVGLPVSDEHQGRHDSPGSKTTAKLLGEFVADRLRDHGESFSKLTLHKHASGKPYACIDGRALGMSISHTRTRLWCALNRLGETGIDAEPADRKVSAALQKRIMHREEQGLLDSGVGVVQLWTIKEAILKYTGTGLRKAMCRVHVKRVGPHVFSSDADGSALHIYSFECRNHWVAVAVNEQVCPPEPARESSEHVPRGTQPPEPARESREHVSRGTHPPESHPPKPPSP